MNTETFFQQFELLADAPNGIKKLRELILQLAVQGKLVSQNPDDEPASVLLERIKAEKERLVKEGKIKKSNKLPDINQDEIPFELPKKWVWSYLANISINVHYGYTASANHDLKDVRLLRITDIQNNRVNWSTVPGCQIEADKLPQYKLNENDLLIARTGGTIGKSYLISDLSVDAVFASYLIRIIPAKSFYSKYFKLFLESELYWNQLYAKSMGTGQPNVNATSLKSLKVSIPPLAEQKRIVEKVDRLMELCDQLETQQQQQHTKTLQLGTVATSRLTTAKTPEAFQQHWQNISNNFDSIYSTPENIKQLRQTILQLAVMGKLVPQNPDDEPASVLLAKIKAEKEKLIKEGKIKKSKKLKAIASDEIPYDLPKNWEWVRMQNIFTVITDGDHQAPPKVDSGVPFLVIGNIRDGFLNFDSTRYVPQKYYQSIGETRTPKREDILYTVVGSYGIPLIVDTDHNFCVQRHIAILKSSQYLDVYYLKYVLQSELVFTQATNYATGIAQKTVPLNGLRKIHVPLPPLTEQHRIVAKVNQLMTYCDELEAKLTQSLSDKEKLMDTAVYQLLTA